MFLSSHIEVVDNTAPDWVVFKFKENSTPQLHIRHFTVNSTLCFPAKVYEATQEQAKALRINEI